MKYRILFVYITILTFFLVDAKKDNKYSQTANEAKENTSDEHDFRPISLKHLDRPFRMAKLNLLWTKAVLVRLSQISVLLTNK